MTHKRDKTAVLTDWGNSLLNQLPGVSRERRKRQASKKRRRGDSAEISREMPR